MMGHACRQRKNAAIRQRSHDRTSDPPFYPDRRRPSPLHRWRLYITIITQRNDARMWQNVFVFQFLPVVLVSSVSSWAPRETYVPPAANVCRPVNSTRSATIIHGRRTSIVRRATHTRTPYDRVVKHRLCGRTGPVGSPRELVRQQRTRERARGGAENIGGRGVGGQ